MVTAVREPPRMLGPVIVTVTPGRDAGRGVRHPALQGSRLFLGVERRGKEKNSEKKKEMAHGNPRKVLGGSRAPPDSAVVTPGVASPV